MAAGGEDGPRAPKQAYWITRADGAPFAFAGLWAIARPAAGGTVPGCAIRNTAANRTVESVHDRMPVILEEQAEAAWLAAAGGAAELASLLRGLPEDQTALRPVGRAVNDARCDGPECLASPLPVAAVAAAPRLF